MSENFKRYLNCYEWETELPGSGNKVKYKPITTGQIKRLLLYENAEDSASIESALDNLINECVVTEGFDINDLYLQDRFFLLLEIRNATKGFKYTFPSMCSKCNSQTFQTVDLSKLPVKKLHKTPIKEEKPKKRGKIEVVDKSENVIEDKKSNWNYVQLNDNIGITMGILTRQMQIDVFNMLKDKKLTEDQLEVESNALGYAMAIESIITPDGIEKNVSLNDKIYLIENLLPAETEIVSNWVINNDFGVELKFKVKCIHCGDEVEREIPLENFFY